MKMREKMVNKLEAILKGIITNKSASTITNPRSEINGTQIIRGPKMIGLLEFTHLLSNIQTKNMKIISLEPLKLKN